MQKKRKKGFLVFIIFVILLTVAAFYAVPFVIDYTNTTPASYKDGKIVIVTIPEGASSEDIAQILKEKGLIKSTLAFKLKAKQSENGSKMNYGTFELYEGMCIDDIIDTLAKSYSYEETVKFTVPEGYSIEWIASEAEKLGFCTKEEFILALDDSYSYDFVAYIPNREGAKYKLQGYLYPDTYEFYKNATAHDIIDKMLGQFEKKLKTVPGINNADLHEVVIIASLLEREALLDSEMTTIAGVIKNRINTGMPLQIDASVQYAVSNGEYNVNRITYDDLEIDSPYNTYSITGLPVGPICNPSITAIEAAMNPEKHDYFYYHTDNDKKDGSHIFTKTYEEHKATQ